MGSSSTDRSPVLVRVVRGIEQSSKIDDGVRAYQSLARPVVANPTVRDLLHGRPLGHALHPILTDVPIGAWVSATILDVLGGPGARPAASKLLGVGILAAGPTALTGLAEWADADRPSQRVGVAHATANVVALSLYSTSWVLRRRGKHNGGVAVGLAAGVVLAWSGYLGGHLAIARRSARTTPRSTPAVPASPPTKARTRGPTPPRSRRVRPVSIEEQLAVAGLDELPVLRRLNEIVELQEAVGKVYLRSGRCTCARAAGQWLARQLCQYGHLAAREERLGRRA
ncbi:DUF2231 domain-containing protein [Georgenia yuyongxinii]|nr:DUF2231 domain-containing protein [Georgenia yuyongxinii]